MYLEHIFCDGLNAQYSFILTITKKIFTSPLLKQPFLLFISVVPFCNVVSNLPHHLNRKTGQVFESEPTVRHCHLHHQLRVCMGAVNEQKESVHGIQRRQLVTDDCGERRDVKPLSLFLWIFFCSQKGPTVSWGTSGTASLGSHCPTLLCPGVAPPHVLCALWVPPEKAIKLSDCPEESHQDSERG